MQGDDCISITVCKIDKIHKNTNYISCCERERGQKWFSYHAWQVASGYVAAVLTGASPPIFFPSVRADTSGHICGTGVLAMHAPSAATLARTMKDCHRRPPERLATQQANREKVKLIRLRKIISAKWNPAHLNSC